MQDSKELLNSINQWKHLPNTRLMYEGLRREIRRLELTLTQGLIVHDNNPQATQEAAIDTLARIESLRWVLEEAWTSHFKTEDPEPKEEIDNEEDYLSL